MWYIFVVENIVYEDVVIVEFVCGVDGLLCDGLLLLD